MDILALNGYHAFYNSYCFTVSKRGHILEIIKKYIENYFMVLNDSWLLF